MSLSLRSIPLHTNLFFEIAKTALNDDTQINIEKIDVTSHQIALQILKRLGQEILSAEPKCEKGDQIREIVDLLSTKIPESSTVSTEFSQNILSLQATTRLHHQNIDPALEPIFLEFPHQIEYSGVMYPSALHAFYAQLFHSHPHLQKEIASIELKELAVFLLKNASSRRIDWTDPQVKTHIMINILKAKFGQDPHAAASLVKTLSSYIDVQGSDDTFWTSGYLHDGANRLGELLMERRESFGGVGMVRNPLALDARKESIAMIRHLGRSLEDIQNEIDTLNAQADDKEYEAHTHIFRFEAPAQISRCPKENLPFDATLVKICGSKLINANFVLQKRYIGTQAPLAHAEEDFWRMVVEQRSQVIVMLNEVHDYLCYPYFPKSCFEDRRVGAANIRLVSDPTIVSNLSWAQSPCEETPHGYIIRKLEVLLDGITHQVTHFQYLNWRDRDKGNEGCVVSLCEKILEDKACLSTPPIIHCAAGVGRTATFIVILDQLKALQEKKEIKIKECLQSLRDPLDGRYYKMVQSSTQYHFCYKVLHSKAWG